MTEKRIHIHQYKSGLVKRYAYYGDLRAVSCAQALLVKYGWKTGRISRVKHTGEFYVFASNTRSNEVMVNLGRKI